MGNGHSKLFMLVCSLPYYILILTCSNFNAHFSLVYLVHLQTSSTEVRSRTNVGTNDEPVIYEKGSVLSVIGTQRLSLVDSLSDKASKVYLIHFVATLRDLVGLEITWTLSPSSP